MFNISKTSPRTKNIIHAAQGFLIFVAWILTIAIYTRTGHSDGRTGWFFGVCWLSIPAIVYLVATPMFPRARKFGNAYSYLAVDALFAVFWFSAWVAIANYLVTGKAAGNGSCSKFGYGSPAKCKMSEATCLIGVALFLLFILTSYLSYLNFLYYRRNGTLPGPDPVMGGDPTFAAQSKDAFSSNPQTDFDDDENRHGGHDEENGGEEYTMLHQSEVDDLGGHNPIAVQAHSALYGTGESLGGGYGGNTGYSGAAGYGPDVGSGHSVSGGQGRYEEGRYSPYGSQNTRY